MPNPFLTVEQLRISYDAQRPVVNQVSFAIAEGELACLLGPSGCGKTTVLRALSGFQTPGAGRITLDGKVLSTPDHVVPPEQRNVGMVFQDHALFPHLKIGDNVGFGLPKLKAGERRERVMEMLTLVGMQDYYDVYPHQLSGGQSQRVALARAIAPRPKLLLMDEPFSNLDTSLRENLGYEVRALLKRLGITAIMVTHDQHDAFALGDQIGVMQQGELMQWGTSFDLYHAPHSRFVAKFIGDGVFVSGEMVEDHSVITGFGELRGESVNQSLAGKKVDLLLRPDDVKYDPQSAIQARVIRKAFKGAQTLYTLLTNSNDTLLCLVPSHDDYEIDDIIGIRIDADHLVCFEHQAANTRSS
jgi:iron(III) transport system ATP-binding protein